MMLGASLMFNMQVHAQWSLTGNANATAASKLGTTNNIPLRLFTYNAERIHINANVSGKIGYVGIGTTAPAQRLHVVGNGLFTGNLGLGVTSPANKLDVAGNGSFTGAVSASTVSGSNPGGSNGVYGSSNTGYGVRAFSTSGYAIYATGGYIGAYAAGDNYGVYGYSAGGYGVYGSSNNYHGGYFLSSGGHGMWARTFSTTAGDYAGVFEGSVYTFGTYISSDRILKKNIRDVENAMSIINKLKPKNYEFRDDAAYANMNLPKGYHYGLIAQEVEEVLPEIVAQAPDGLGAPMAQPSPDIATDQAAVNEKKNFIPSTKAINYTELIPIIIKAMQEQQKEIADLKADNLQLKNDMQSCCLNHSSAHTQDKLQQSPGEKAYLEQNAPNPFTDQTVIRYYLPASSTGLLKVMSLDGKEMYAQPLTKTGYGELTISASTMAAGTYTYTLMVNGKAVESRIMILSE